MNLFKASSLIFCNAANSISAFTLQSASGLRNKIIPQLGLRSLKVNSPKVIISLELRKPGRQKGHPLSSLDSFELYPEIIARWTFYRTLVLLLSGYLLSQVSPREIGKMIK